MVRRTKRNISHVKKLLIAIYIRLSRNDTDDESESVTNQRKMLIEYCQERFANEDYEIVEVYCDDGKSGTDDTQRNDFVRMIQDIRQHKINLILCKSLSRAFRNHSDQGYYLEDFFPRNNVDFITISDPIVDTLIDSESIYGFEIPMNGIVNDRLAYRTSVDVRKSFDAKRKRGEFIGAFAKYGYKKSIENKNKVIIDKEPNDVMKQIGEWLGYNAKSPGWVANKLNELGILNPTGYKQSKGLKYRNPHAKGTLWNETTVRRYARDKFYLGHMVQGKQKIVSYKVHEQVQVPESEWYIVENTHEPTFSQELFDLIQKNLDRTPKRSNKAKKEYMLSGYVYCADCGYSMHRKSSKNLAYYHCSTYTKRSKSHCTKHTIREDILIEVVLQVIQKEIDKISDIKKLIDKIKNNPQAKIKTDFLDNQLKANETMLNKNQNRIDRLYNDLLDDLIDKEQYQRIKENLKNESIEIIKNNEQLKKEKDDLKNNISATDTYIETFMKYKNIKKLNRGILQSLVDKIEITEDKKIIITFEFQQQVNNLKKFIEDMK